MNDRLDRTGVRGLALGCLGVIGLMAVPATAEDGEASGSSGGGGLQLASEVIGTLPTWWVDDVHTVILMPSAEQTEYQRDLHLESYVPYEELEDFVAEATGEGYVFLSLPADYDGLVRVRFFGDVHVEIERDKVESLGLPIALELGVDNHDGIGAISVDGVVGPAFELAPLTGEVALPFGMSPAFDALFEGVDVSLYSAAPLNTGWDVGRFDVGVEEQRFVFDQVVVESLIP